MGCVHTVKLILLARSRDRGITGSRHCRTSAFACVDWKVKDGPHVVGCTEYKTTHNKYGTDDGFEPPSRKLPIR